MSIWVLIGPKKNGRCTNFSHDLGNPESGPPQWGFGDTISYMAGLGLFYQKSAPALA
jgi:hypothetical protein